MQPAHIVVSGVIQREMRVCVHESRCKRCIPQVDHLRAARRRQIAANVNDRVSLHNDDAILHQRFRFPIEHALGFKHDNLIGRLGRDSET